MSLRRSTRLQNQVTQDGPEPVEVQRPPPVEVVRNNKKRKAPAPPAEGSTGPKKKATKPAIGNTLGKGIKPPSQAQFSSSNDLLSSLPAEILFLILDNIKDPSTIGKLGRTCKRYYSLMMPLLHKRVAVAVMFHAHISKLIRALEPHLTIAQKRQLKKEGNYKGQQERYPSHLDANAKPASASHVREMVVGVADPGRKHQYIVHRYVEEVFKNVNNLEIVEVYFLTKSMGQSIASLKNIQALRLHEPEIEAMTPLAKIKNLKHLSVENSSFNNNIVQSILLNSTSTLRSLVVKGNGYAISFLQDWEKKVSADDALAKREYSLTVLKSFTLSGVSFDATFITSLQRAIDYMGLCELTLGHLSDGKHLFFQHLTNLATSSHNSATGISLRSLCLEMSDDRYGETPEHIQTNFEAKCRFISAFDTLTTLEVKDYNQYPNTITTNPGLPDTLLQAILKHQNLRSLKISYQGMVSGCKIPYLSATTVAAIIDNLPQLQDLEFAPEEAEINEIGEALSRGTNLTSITCFPHDSWARHPQPDEPGRNILLGIVNGFLSRADGSGSGKFIWEDHFKLQRVSVTYKVWEVASKFGKPEKGTKKKGMKKAEKIKSGGDGTREVLYRDISGTFPIRIHVGYDPDFAWVEKVANDI
ncbi:hypothetical protein P152DRAFT_387111 [Eremomyces bilateralis CBS 781.70]|uniref:F-box domain-containing protein n=1 Tax=Eremomyces bilateralis CBS 781.70 TaxID=1392243 RepID=A0A6G1GG18_9PEZI|nr:uncharacterized protein P152DRAFT_387111 [Eremomyces bilateralis CBS 781.70]KAF1817037.1 hypothetical protein P152DRAFT_387111 [Eremomyces bilateralis CBS 781.70]